MSVWYDNGLGSGDRNGGYVITVAVRICCFMISDMAYKADITNFMTLSTFSRCPNLRGIVSWECNFDFLATLKSVQPLQVSTNGGFSNCQGQLYIVFGQNPSQARINSSMCVLLVALSFFRCEKLLRCSSCRLARYCNRTCQVWCCIMVLKFVQHNRIFEYSYLHFVLYYSPHSF